MITKLQTILVEFLKTPKKALYDFSVVLLFCYGNHDRDLKPNSVPDLSMHYARLQVHVSLGN